MSACAVSASGDRSPLERFTLSCARSDEERTGMASFRRQLFLDRRSVAFDELLEARRDRDGHLFLLTEGTLPVATGRVLAYPSRLSPVLGLGQELGAAGADSEVGRIAAARSTGGIRASLILLTLGSIWLLRQSGHRRYVAYCHPKLLDLYRAVGAEDLGISCAVPGRSDEHRIVSGTYDQAAARGARLLGVSEAQAQRSIRFDGLSLVREGRCGAQQAVGSSS